MTDRVFWPTVIWHRSLGLSAKEQKLVAIMAPLTVDAHRTGPHPHQRDYYDIFEEVPELMLLEQVSTEMARDYLATALRYGALRFAIRAKGWANTYERGQYIAPHTHLGDLTMSYCCDGEAWAVVTDPRPIIGFGRANQDWANRTITLKAGEALLHPSGIAHHLAPTNRRYTMVSIDFYVTPAKGEVVEMGGA